MMSKKVRVLFTKDFWLDAFERALKATAGGTASFFTVGGLVPHFDVTWRQAVLGGVAAAGFSIVTSIASAPVGGTVSPASLIQPPSQ